MPTKIRRKDPSESVTAVFGRNLAMLVDQRQRANPKLTKAQIAKSVGLSIRKLSTIRAGANRPYLDTLDLVAEEFGLDPWQLLLPDLPSEFLLNTDMQRSIRMFIQSDPEDRRAIEHLLQKRYKAAYG